MRFVLAAAFLVALSACGETSGPDPEPEQAPEAVEPGPLDPNAPAAELAALSSCGVVTAQGYCGIEFGVAPGEARAKFPVDLDTYSGGDPTSQNDPNRCYEMLAASPVQGVSFLVEMNRVGRLDVISEGVRTADGFGVGTPAEDIKTRFGAAVSEQPNKYEAEVTELVVSDGGTKFIFEMQEGHVRAWRAGVMPTIDYVEHCG